jgi:hypothetical protein
VAFNPIKKQKIYFIISQPKPSNPGTFSTGGSSEAIFFSLSHYNASMLRLFQAWDFNRGYILYLFGHYSKMYMILENSFFLSPQVQVML